MGTPLTGKTPANTYDALIKIGDNSPLTSNLKVLSDGLGNDLPLTVSSTAITITGNATFSANVDATGAVLTVATQSANDNSTKAASTAYVDNSSGNADLDFGGDNASTGNVLLNTQTFQVSGTANEIVTAASNQSLTFSLDSSGVNLPDNSTAITQTAGDSSTKIATTAFVSSESLAQDLDFSGDTGTGAVILNTETFAVTGTTNQITTTASGTGLALSLPSTVHRNLQGNVTGNLTGDVTGDLTGNVTATSVLADGVIGTTQAVADDSTKVATTAFVQDVVGTIPAGLVFQGTWNANTNTPTLASGTGTTGHFYIVSVAGTTDLDGVTDWAVGDWAVFVEQGATDQWEKVDNSSVLDGNGTGGKISKWAGSGNSVTLTDSIITESGSNIGIDKDNPNQKLHLHENTSGANYIQITNTDTGSTNADGVLIGLDSAEILRINQRGSKAIKLFTNATERFTVNATGAIRFANYGAGTLVSDASGNITSISGGGEGGPYLPLAGGTLTGDVTLNDNVKASFGSSSDLEIYHDAGGDSYIKELGTGQFYIQAENFRFKSADGASTLITANVGGAVSLYYDNSKKFETTSSGVTVSGAIVTNLASEGTYFTGGSGGIRQLSITSGTNTSAHALHTFNINSSNGKYKFDINGTEQFSINSGDSTFAGNVTANGGNLQVKSSSVPTILLYNTDTSLGTDQTLGDLDWYQSDPSGDGVGVVAKIRGINQSSFQGEAGLAFYTGGSSSILERMRIDSGGRVGIGTSPTYNLDLLATNAVSMIRTPDTTSATLGLFVNSGSNGVGVIATDNGGDMTFDTGSTGAGQAERMRIDSSGNVGIGTTLPTNGGGNGSWLSLNAVTSSPYSGGIVYTIANAVKAYHYVESGYLRHQAQSGLGHRFTVNGTTDAMYITSSGNVGIGTASPDKKLEVFGDIKISGGDYNGLFFENASGTTKTLLYQHAGYDALVIKDIVNNADRVTFKNNGNVGIGTTSPYGTLNVIPSSNPTSATAANQISIGESSANSAYNLRLGYFLEGGAYKGSIQSIAGDTPSTLVLNGDGGNVGIGVAAPTTKLQVAGTISSSSTVENGTAQISILNANTATPAEQFYVGNNLGDVDFGNKRGALKFFTGTTEKMRITSGGEVQIAKSIHLGSDSAAVSPADYSMLIEAPSGTDTNLNMYTYGSSVFNIASDGTTARIGWGSGASREVNFTNTGAGALLVGINTGTPTTTLSIHGEGTADITTIKTGTNVNTNVGAIVFRDSDNDYCGQITVNGSTNVTQYLSASDYRLKDDLKDFNALEKISKIPVYDFKWKSSNTRDYGVIAHELQEILPQAVDGEKDAVENYEITKAVTDNDGNVIEKAVLGTRNKIQSVDYAKLVPLLVGAIQELKAEIELLKAK